MRRATVLFVLAALGATADDTILKAMRDEMARSRQLRIASAEEPYYIEYGLDDVHTFNALASLGALINQDSSRLRAPRVQVRVGSPDFDNTNYVFSDFFARSAAGRFPLEDDYETMRRYFWLATDRVFKGSVEAIARKRAALRNITQQEKLADFAPAPPRKLDSGVTSPEPERRHLEVVSRIKSLSSIFNAFPGITASSVSYGGGSGTSYVVTSEGTEVRYPDDLFSVRVRASAQAPDGMPIHGGLGFDAHHLSELASEADMTKQIQELAENLAALASAPVGEDYSGPVLIEGDAAAQMFAQVLGPNLTPSRRPVSEPGRNVPIPSSELEGRIGSRVLPEWMDVVDDPTMKEWNGRKLMGYFPVDMEGVVPAPLPVIEKGVFKRFFLTRQPVRGHAGSNGRARLPGAFGAKTSTISTLIVKPSESVPAAELRQKLIDMLKQRDKEYGLIVRQLDFPSTSSNEELRRLATSSAQRGGGVRAAALPLLVYKVDREGKETLVRGLRFRSLNVRALRDIVAASSESRLFNFVSNGSPLPTLGGGGYVAGQSVIAPAVLFEDLELDRREEDWPKLPVVPAPPLSASGR